MFRSVFGYCILLFAIQISAFSQEADYKLLKNTASTLILSYTPEYIDTSIVTVFNNTYRKVVFRFGEDTEDLVVGAPSILARKFIIGLPSSQNNTVKVLSYKSRIISGRLIPIPEKQVNSKGILVYRENESYKSNGFLPESLVNLSKFGELRGLTTGELSISPVRFYPGENKIEIITSIEVQIDFPNINVAASYQSDKFLNGLVLNTSVAKNWVKRANSLEKTSSVSSALFAQGKWYRFEAPDEGIYKITRDMLSSL
ncbi:MAG: hypothetical protein HYV28_01320, partial [Ignavibacteriales bacterium]|nr:hypothetical protein [Ignavibacteriales bacterium]